MEEKDVIGIPVVGDLGKLGVKVDADEGVLGVEDVWGGRIGGEVTGAFKATHDKLKAVALGIEHEGV